MRTINCEQGSLEWHQLRTGKVTGTTLKSALGSKTVQKTLLNKIVAERMTEPQIDDLNAPAVVRGRELEPIARRAVEKQTGLSFTETGIMVSDDIEGFAFSPDGIEVATGEGGIEIKCPDSKKHVEYLIDGGIPKDYYHQVMAPFLMSDRFKWWIFASFDDRNYEKPLFIKRVTREDFPDIEENRKKLKTFLAEVEAAHLELTF